MPHPDSDDIEEIARLFHRELLLHHTKSETDLDELFQDHVTPDIMGIHAHYDEHPRSHRRRDHHELPLWTMREFYEELFKGYAYPAKLYHTLLWLKINERTGADGGVRGAVAAVVYEGIYVPNDEPILRQSSTSDGQVEIDKRAYHCHMSVYTLRKDHPFDDNVWQTHNVLAGLPATGYRPKINPHDYPDAIPGQEEVRVQCDDELWEASTDKHDIALFIDVDEDDPIANRFYGWEITAVDSGVASCSDGGDDDDDDDD
jgi:hypothetical protein